MEETFGFLLTNHDSAKSEPQVFVICKFSMLIIIIIVPFFWAFLTDS